MDKLKFLADTMLGSLAKKLRLLGIDTVYISDPDNSELKYLVRSQTRILLTRNLNLSRSMGDLAWPVTGKDVREEFLSIAERMRFFSELLVPFSRCLDCNELLQSIEFPEAEGKVPPYIFMSNKPFSRCPSCRKVFWEGTHSKRMKEEVQWMKSQLQGTGRLQ